MARAPQSSKGLAGLLRVLERIDDQDVDAIFLRSGWSRAELTYDIVSFGDVDLEIAQYR